MTEQKQVKKTGTKRTDEEVEDVAPAGAEQGDKLREEMDDLLDEIDAVLENNAEDFVKGYVQKGGQ